MIFTEKFSLGCFHSWLTILGFCNTQAGGIDASCHKAQYTYVDIHLQLQNVNIPCVESRAPCLLSDKLVNRMMSSVHDEAR